MAFEAYLTQDQARPTHRRRLTYTLSLLVHGALLAVGVVYSFWHVEELSPPTVRVTFLSAATPPPPPPPPPAGGGAPKKKAPVKPKTTVTPTVVQPRNNIVQPRERALTDPVRKDPPPVDPKQKDAGDDPPFPAVLRKTGTNYLVIAKICVDRAGTVESVTLMKKADSLLDSSVVTTVKGWRFRPWKVNDTPVPFCYFGNFEFKSE